MQVVLNAPQIIWIVFHLVSVIVAYKFLPEQMKSNFFVSWLISTSFEVFLLYWGGFFSNGLVQ